MIPPPPGHSHGRNGLQSSERRDRWLLSYGDFMTLLLALFVVLYASARAESEKSSNLVEGIQSAFRFETPPLLIAAPIPIEMIPASEQLDRGDEESEVEPLVQMQQLIAAVLEEQERAVGETSGATLHQSERGLVLSLASAEFFPQGGVTIPPERRVVLAALAPFLGAHSGSLQFEGHTDAQPIASETYPSNWELSSARAAAVARLFIDEHGIDPSKVATSGYAEFRPIAERNEADPGARNRRVEIIIMEDGELVADRSGDEERSELDRLLDVLPPLPKDADASLKAKDPGPPPPDIPLP